MPEYDAGNPLMTGHPPAGPKGRKPGWYPGERGRRWWYWDGLRWTDYEWGKKPPERPVHDA